MHAKGISCSYQIPCALLQREGRAHFNCSSLEGVALEDGGGSFSAFTHWEERILDVSPFQVCSLVNHMHAYMQRLIDITSLYIINAFSKQTELNNCTCTSIAVTLHLCLFTERADDGNHCIECCYITDNSGVIWRFRVSYRKLRTFGLNCTHAHQLSVIPYC